MTKVNVNELDSSLQLQNIYDLIVNKKYHEALAVFDNCMNDGCVNSFLFFMLKAMAECSLGNRHQALETLINSPFEVTNAAYWHLAGECALELGRLGEAITYLSTAINIELDKGEKYFLTTCYLERSYANIRVGKIHSAMADLERIDDSESIMWLKGIEVLNKEKLLSKILGHDRGYP